MRAILVCVDFADILALTLPYNRSHFQEVTVVTTVDDIATHKVAAENGAKLYCTNAFFLDGAIFNKWKSLEQGLDAMGRDGWICVMDADILWPREAFCTTCKGSGLIDVTTALNKKYRTHAQCGCPVPTRLIPGKIYTPFRRMMEEARGLQAVPDERTWHIFPLHPQQREWAGYTQIFHASDPRLGKPPWHETNWKHCGGADSFFQAKWPQENKLRPPFEVLHLGPSGQNWCGRATPYLDGSVHALADRRKQQVKEFILGRRQGPDRFAAEKLG